MLCCRCWRCCCFATGGPCGRPRPPRIHVEPQGVQRAACDVSTYTHPPSCLALHRKPKCSSGVRPLSDICFSISHAATALGNDADASERTSTTQLLERSIPYEDSDDPGQSNCASAAVVVQPTILVSRRCGGSSAAVHGEELLTASSVKKRTLREDPPPVQLRQYSSRGATNHTPLPLRWSKYLRRTRRRPLDGCYQRTRERTGLVIRGSVLMFYPRSMFSLVLVSVHRFMVLTCVAPPS